jgi:hypothetical protein
VNCQQPRQDDGNPFQVAEKKMRERFYGSSQSTFQLLLYSKHPESPKLKSQGFHFFKLFAIFIQEFHILRIQFLVRSIYIQAIIRYILYQSAKV